VWFPSSPLFEIQEAIVRLSPRVSGSSLCLSLFLTVPAFAADPPQQGSAGPAETSAIQSAPEGADVAAPKDFQYGPIQSSDPEVRAQIKKLYRDQADLDKSTNAHIDALVKSLENSADADLQLRVHEEVMAAKQELLIKSMEIGLEIARLNQDERRVAEFEKALDQMLNPEKYVPQTLDPSIAEERAREMGLK
jgi:hypothetical protein